LCTGEQIALIVTLYECAHQAGFNEQIYKEALTEAALKKDDVLVCKSLSFHEPDKYLDLVGFEEWLTQLNNTSRFTVFKMCVYLFAKAESNVYKNETKESCNHWWHRDLLDEKVLQSILKNPRYYMTAMRDDDAIKQA